MSNGVFSNAEELFFLVVHPVVVIEKTNTAVNSTFKENEINFLRIYLFLTKGK